MNGVVLLCLSVKHCSGARVLTYLDASGLSVDVSGEQTDLGIHSSSFTAARGLEVSPIWFDRKKQQSGFCTQMTNYNPRVVLGLPPLSLG